MGSTGGCIYISSPFIRRPHLTQKPLSIRLSSLTPLQFFHPFPPFSRGLTATPAQDCFLIPTPQSGTPNFTPLFACCVISKPMHACPLTPTAYTSSLVFRPLHFDVTPSAECVLTAIPTHSSVLYVQTARAPYAPTPQPCFSFSANIIGPFSKVPYRQSFCAATAQEGAAWLMSMSDWPKCVSLFFCPENSCHTLCRMGF